MFVKAIQEVSKYTRPIHTVTRTFKDVTAPGASTLFFINENGVAITCKHVAELFLAANQANPIFEAYKNELATYLKDPKQRHNTKQLETKYGFKSDTTVQVLNSVIASFDTVTGFQCHLHPTLDLAIMEFKGYNATQYTSYATFVKDASTILQGRTLCRLGYPFPKFDNFSINRTNNNVEWTNNGNGHSLSFPMDGIITRFYTSPDANNKQIVSHIEMSTPGLRGQSGGPLFDSSGLVYGMQSATSNLHLGFDVKNHEVVFNGKKSQVNNHPFLHVGICIHLDRIKDFLNEKQIKFYEG